MGSQRVGHDCATSTFGCSISLLFCPNGNNNPVYETAKETLMCRTVFWTLWERKRVGWFGRMALKHVYYHMKWVTSPGSMHDNYVFIQLTSAFRSSFWISGLEWLGEFCFPSFFWAQFSSQLFTTSLGWISLQNKKLLFFIVENLEHSVKHKGENNITNYSLKESIINILVYFLLDSPTFAYTKLLS